MMSSMVNKDLLDTFKVCFVDQKLESERTSLRKKALDAFKAKLSKFFLR